MRPASLLLPNITIVQNSSPFSQMRNAHSLIFSLASHHFLKPMSGYKFKCKDIGMKCDFEVKGTSSKDEVMQIAAVHAKQEHQMDTVPSDVAARSARR